MSKFLDFLGQSVKTDDIVQSIASPKFPKAQTGKVLKRDVRTGRLCVKWDNGKDAWIMPQWVEKING